MTKENAKDYLPLVEAISRGEIIQQKSYYNGNWVDIEFLDFTRAPNYCTIKPKTLNITREQVEKAFEKCFRFRMYGPSSSFEDFCKELGL